MVAREGSPPASEVYALQIIQELEKAKAPAIGEEMGFSPEYAALLCRSLWKASFIRGTAVTGYEVTVKGEELLARLGKYRG